MLLVNQIKLKPGFTTEELTHKAASVLKVFEEDIDSVEIDKISIDGRKKPDVFMIVSAIVSVKNENSVLKRIKNGQVSLYKPVIYNPEITGTEELKERPLIVGAGPAGLFAAYFLAQYGYRPIVCERGLDIESRTRDVEEFFKTGKLNPSSNVQFGEGGAGAFSDGKLNTLVKDKEGRSRKVLEIFTKFGADPSILTDAKPHIGTDVLFNVVKSMREEIKSLGGEFRFNAEITDIFTEDSRIKGVLVNNLVKIPAQIVILAIGHSARNTFEMLYERKINLEQKDFAVGLRIEHPQNVINRAMYGNDTRVWEKLPAASYKLTFKASSGRGVYSFCMCPGGYVVNASSEPLRTAVNGMSYSKRDGKHANSAIIVTVTGKDFESSHPLQGIKFQRELEEKAYRLGNGAIPVQFYKDYKNEVNTGLSDINDMEPDAYLYEKPECKGSFIFTNVSEILPAECNKSIVEAIEYFDRIIPGFSDDKAILSGVESRTSSPVRIVRDENFESINTKGLYPAGEGAGYAGGIMSAAMDGMKIFEAIASKYKPMEETT